MAVNGEDSNVITLTLDARFAKLYETVRRQHPSDIDTINSPILALDPGETTGVAEFDGDVTIRVYQKVTKNIGQSYDWLKELIYWGASHGADEMPERPFSHLRYEDYRVYEWKVQDHAWSPVHTIQWIGAIKVAAHTTGVQSSCVMASVAKNWWTDNKLDIFGLNPKGLRHGRDALRHLLYYILFPTKAD